jgi:hypothetical protein
LNSNSLTGARQPEIKTAFSSIERFETILQSRSESDQPQPPPQRYFSHLPYSHIPMDGDAEIDEKVDHALYEFGIAKTSYYRGDDGPYFLHGEYSLAVFERLQEVVESNWCLAYFDNEHTICLFGDPSYLHGHLTSLVYNSLVAALNDYMIYAPESGVRAIDRSNVNKCNAFLQFAFAPTISLPLHPDPAQNVPSPFQVMSADGTIRQEPDLVGTIPRQYTSSGEPVIAFLFQSAYRNETLKILGWELCRARAARAVVSAGIKIHVSEKNSCPMFFSSH